jgi:hypothetical protein
MEPNITENDYTVYGTNTITTGSSSVHAVPELCAICLDDDLLCCTTDSSACFLQCGHVFHSVCSLKWFVENRSCPVCRSYNVQCQHEHLHDHSSIALAEVMVSQTKQLETLRAETIQLKADVNRLAEQINMFMEEYNDDIGQVHSIRTLSMSQPMYIAPSPSPSTSPSPSPNMP